MLKFNKPTNNFLFVSCTRHTKANFEKQNKLYKSIKILEKIENVEFKIHYENITGLSKIYNQYINENYRNKIVIFLHDDVIIEDLFLIEKLTDSHKTNDIVGLAGTVGDIDFTLPHLMWHTCSFDNWSENIKHLRGFVQHPHQLSSQNNLIINQTAFGYSPCKVNFIDGLFMSCKISSLLDNKVFFDEDFDWHFYDISFCFRAKKANLNVAVSPIHVLHYALGDSCFSDKFAENQNKFRKKYGTR